MSKFRLLTYMLILTALAGCSKKEHSPISTTQAITPTIPTSSYPPPGLTITPPLLPSPTTTLPSMEQVATSTPGMPPEYILRYSPIVPAPNLPPGAAPPGTLVLAGLGDDPSYYVNFEQGSREKIPDDRTCFSTSPDGKWITYCQSAEEPSSRDLLFVESADGKEMKKLDIDEDWFFGDPRWLDNQRLVFNLLKDNYTGPLSILPMEIVNPFTGERQELVSDYPDMRPSVTGPGGSTMSFIVSTVVYDPSLDLVVYPKATQEGYFVVLWDRQTQQALASLNAGGFSHTPMWHPDGEYFLIAATPEGGRRSDDYSVFVNEWFSISREGDIQQLTHFGDFFEHADIGIGRSSLSPDGEHLAFWLETWPSLCEEGQHLAILEIETLQVTLTCIPGSYTLSAMPGIWSPDSRYFAMISSYPDRHSVILLNVEEGWAAKIGEDLFPVGWLAGP